MSRLTSSTDLLEWSEIIFSNSSRVRMISIATDTMVDFTRGNIRGYWQAQPVLAQHPVEAGTPELASWWILGIPRLHHVLTRRRVTSKGGAGRYALKVFDQRWQPLIRDALMYRETGNSEPWIREGSPRGHNVIAYAHMCVESALKL